jgi:hypothetical protein
MEHGHRLGLRLLCVAALTLCSVALYSILTNGLGSAPAVASADTQLTLLTERVAAVGSELRALAPRRRAARARRAVIAAMRAREEAASWLGQLRASGARVQAPERLSNALDALHDWLDAVGSTLSNPNSPRRRELTEVGRRARAAFASLPSPGGMPEAIGGEERLLRFAASRR